MPHDFLCDAPDQYMLEPGQPVRRCDDQIDIVMFCKSADIQCRRAFRKRRRKFDASKVYRTHEISHFALGMFASSLLQAGNVIESGAFARIDVPEVRRM